MFYDFQKGEIVENLSGQTIETPNEPSTKKIRKIITNKEQANDIIISLLLTSKTDEDLREVKDIALMIYKTLADLNNKG